MCFRDKWGSGRRLLITVTGFAWGWQVAQSWVPKYFAPMRPKFVHYVPVFEESPSYCRFNAHILLSNLLSINVSPIRYPWAPWPISVRLSLISCNLSGKRNGSGTQRERAEVFKIPISDLIFILFLVRGCRLSWYGSGHMCIGIHLDAPLNGIPAGKSSRPLRCSNARRPRPGHPASDCCACPRLISRNLLRHL